MFELKPLSAHAIPAALEKAVRYRLLNEPGEAESICLDVLEVDAENQQALTTMLLARTDRFAKGHAASVQQAREVLPRLKDEYQRAYFAGLIRERQAKARLQGGGPGAGHDAYEWLREAMKYFEQAEAIRPASNDDAILRWNACVRIIERNQLTARSTDRSEPYLE